MNIYKIIFNKKTFDSGMCRWWMKMNGFTPIDKVETPKTYVFKIQEFTRKKKQKIKRIYSDVAFILYF